MQVQVEGSRGDGWGGDLATLIPAHRERRPKPSRDRTFSAQQHQKPLVTISGHTWQDPSSRVPFVDGWFHARPHTQGAPPLHPKPRTQTQTLDPKP